MKVTCDSSVVKAYAFTADAPTVTSKTYYGYFRDDENYKITTTKYTCGDKVRIKSNKASAIVLI